MKIKELEDAIKEHAISSGSYTTEEETGEFFDYRHDKIMSQAAQTMLELMKADDWQLMESAPKDGKPFYVKASYQVPFKWKFYSPKSQQFKRGIKGRWQEMNEYCGWDNSDKTPDQWKPKT